MDATPRPWTLSGPRGRHIKRGRATVAETLFDYDNPENPSLVEAQDNATLIVTAVNAHEALLAVARAAKRMMLADQAWTDAKDGDDPALGRECVASEDGLRDALAALPPDLLAET